MHITGLQRNCFHINDPSIQALKFDPRCVYKTDSCVRQIVWTLPVTVNLPHAVGGREVGSDGRGGGGQHKRLERSLAILYSPPCTGRVSCKPLHAVFWKHFQFFWHARIDFGVLVLVINV